MAWIPNFLERALGFPAQSRTAAREGEFKRLETTMPPQSPVAWSTFITGMDPGGHGIYDFIHRNPQTLMPFSSMAQTTEGAPHALHRSVCAAAFAGKVRIVPARQGILADSGRHTFRSRFIRMPTNFPPIECEGESLSGWEPRTCAERSVRSRSYTDDPAR